MQVPSEISYRGFDPTSALKEHVQERIDKLDRLHSRLMTCRVAVEQLHHNKKTGNPYHVRIDLTAPGLELIVNRDPTPNKESTDVFRSVQDAFNAMEKKLRRKLEKRRFNPTKAREQPLHGIVVKLFPEDRYGFIDGEDGQEVYFDARSVLNGFENLNLYNEVRFQMEWGDKGPQASTVHRVGKHGKHFFSHWI